MKKAIIVLAIILTSGITALSLNKKVETKTAQVKIDKVSLVLKGYNNFKSDISTAD